MADETGEAGKVPLRVPSDSRLELDLRGAEITSDDGPRAYRAPDDGLGLTAIADRLAEVWR
jgi:hypothetical protein